MELSLEKIFYVYEWYYKNTNEVFYVGKGKNNRYMSRNRRNSYFLNVLKKEKNNVDVRFVKKELTEEEAFKLERQLIAEYKSQGQCKTNFHEGGCGGHTGNYQSLERSRKLSNAAKLRVGKLNPMYGKTHTNEVKEYLREINQGRKLTEEHRQKLIKANTSRRKSEEERREISVRMKGRKMSDKTHMLMLQSLCFYEYQIWLGGEMIKSCLGHTALYRFCKDEFNISRTIVDQIVKDEWKPKFNRHMHLKNLKIKVIDRRVSTKDDECNPCRVDNDTTRSA